MGLVNNNPLRCQGVDDYVVDGQFDTNNTGVPDGLAPNHGSDLAIARTGVGVFTLTFAGAKKPLRARLLAQVLGDEPNLRAVPVSYVPSTGVATIKVYSNSAGTWTAADTTDKTIQYVLLCSRANGSK